MKIKAKSKFDYKTIKALARIEVYRKANPLKKMLTYCLIAVLLAAVLVLQMYLLDVSVLPVVLLAVAVLMLLFELYLFFIFPRTRYNGMGEMKGAVHEYVFQDRDFQVLSKDNGFKDESRIDYDVLSKAIETRKFLFIFHHKTQVFIVEKETVSGGTPEALREKLQSVLGERYVIYKY